MLHICQDTWKQVRKAYHSQATVIISLTSQRSQSERQWIVLSGIHMHCHIVSNSKLPIKYPV